MLLRPSLISFFGLLLAGCVTQPDAAAGNLSPPPQWSGPRSGVNVASLRVVHGENEWAGLWQQFGRKPPQPLAAGDMAVALFLGERPTAGYRAEVITAREHDNQLVIEYREHVPAADRMVAQVLTSPWAVAVLPASNLPVVTRRLPPDRTTATP